MEILTIKYYLMIELTINLNKLNYVDMWFPRCQHTRIALAMIM